MASNYTENYGLCQWEATDHVLREEFNQDHAKIDTALGDLKANVVRTAVGSYEGNGQCGESAPNHLDFDFSPKMVILVFCYRIKITIEKAAARRQLLFYSLKGN